MTIMLQMRFPCSLIVPISRYQYGQAIALMADILNESILRRSMQALLNFGVSQGTQFSRRTPRYYILSGVVRVLARDWGFALAHDIAPNSRVSTSIPRYLLVENAPRPGVFDKGGAPHRHHVYVPSSAPRQLAFALRS